jgi:predicted DCC family thiol-disulfide oxidoreductase YuxK
MQPIEVYYDGLCHLCSREVNLIRRLALPGKMTFTDIMAPGFEAEKLGLDAKRIHQHMHVRDAQGTMQIGVDALITMWEAVPYFRHLAFFSKLPGFYTLSKIGYAFFAWIRPKLPRKKCETGVCEVR